MRNELMKLCKRKEQAEMIYMRADGQLTKRRLQILTVGTDSFTAYCYLRRSKRTFKMDRVLSVQRIERREPQAI